MAESARQQRITDRMMHEFKHGEQKSGSGGKGGRVKSRRQAIAIALEEAGDSKYESEGHNPATFVAPRRRKHSFVRRAEHQWLAWQSRGGFSCARANPSRHGGNSVDENGLAN